jgi:hypothetical protein
MCGFENITGEHFGDRQRRTTERKLERNYRQSSLKESNDPRFKPRALLYTP